MNQELDLRTPLPSGDHTLLEKYKDLGQAAAEGLTKTYRSSSGETDQGNKLANLLTVAKFLKDKGYKVGKSKIYQDVKHIRQEKDGSYTEASVIRYAERYLRLRGASVERKDHKTTLELDRAQEEKVIQEARKLKAQADLAETKAKILSGYYIPKDLFNRELSNRASILRADEENWAMGQISHIISLVKGDIDLAPELSAYLMIQIDTWFSRYAEDREFTVQPTTIDSAIISDNDQDEGEENSDNR